MRFKIAGALFFAALLIGAAPQATLTVTVTPSPSPSPTANGSYAVGQTDTFGGCQLFPTNDLFNLDIYGVPVDSTSAAQISNASSHYSGSLEGPFESGYTNYVPDSAPTVTVTGTNHTIYAQPWPIANTSSLPYRNGVLPYETSDPDLTDAFVQGAGGGRACRMYIGGSLVPAGSPTGTTYSAYGGGAFPMNTALTQYPPSTYGGVNYGGASAGGTGMSSSGIPGRLMDPRPDEFINGIVPHIVDVEWPIAAACKPSVANQYPSLQGNQGSISSEPCLSANAHIRLKASFSTAGYSGDALTMIYQLKHYGGLIIDNGCSDCFGIYFAREQNGHGGVPADSRDTNFSQIGTLFGNLTINNFEVIKMGPTNGSAYTYPGIDTSTGIKQGY